MKKIITLLLIMLCVCACSLRKSEEYTVDQIINHDNRSETIGQTFRTEAVWVVEPSMVMEGVEMLEADFPFGYPLLERVGYPQEWDYMAGKGPFIVDKAEYIGAPIYTANAIATSDKGIYDYDGNLLNKDGYASYYTDAGFSTRLSENENMFSICSGDFIGIVQRNAVSGLGGGYLGLFEYKGTLYNAVIDYRDVSREITGYAYQVLMEDIDIEKDLEHRKATADDLFGHRAAVPIMERIITSESQSDTAIYDEKGNRLFVFDETEDTEEIDFTNGFLTILHRLDDNDYSKNRYAFFSVDEQNYITDFDYEEVLPFVEGYAAVKKDGKWGYINESGEEVTDFIWDNVSTMYDGRVYVGLKDRFGILDLKATLAKGTKVTMESCYGSADPEMAYTAISALAEFVPQQKERDPEAVAAEAEYEKAHKILGLIIPRFNDINIREKPNTSAKVVGVLLNSGTEEEEFYYPQYVYEVTEAEGYTWYRIGTDRWVADHGNWYEVEMFGE